MNKLRAVNIPPFGPRLYLWAMICRRGRLPEEDRDILLHDLLVINCISDVNVRLKGDMRNCRIEVQDVRWSRVVLRVQIRIDPLHKGRLSSTRHANSDDQTWFSWLVAHRCQLVTFCDEGGLVSKKADEYTNTNNSIPLTSTAIWSQLSIEHTEVAELRHLMKAVV